MRTSHSSFASFMASPFGRGFRILLGLALIAWGGRPGTGFVGPFLMVVGLVPLAAGVFNVCLIAPILRAPFSGEAARGGDRHK